MSAVLHFADGQGENSTAYGDLEHGQDVRRDDQAHSDCYLHPVPSINHKEALWVR